jgi:hypothetical protein
MEFDHKVEEHRGEGVTLEGSPPYTYGWSVTVGSYKLRGRPAVKVGDETYEVKEKSQEF